MNNVDSDCGPLKGVKILQKFSGRDKTSQPQYCDYYAECISCGGVFTDHFIANLLLNVAVKKFYKSVND